MIEQIKVHRIRSTIGAAALVLVLSTLAYLFWNKNSKHLVTDDPINSVAVLPFINTTSDPYTEHLTLGITDNVINKLSRLPKLKVSSLNAVLRYSGKPIDEQKIGRDLKVGAVLISRLTQRGDDLMISTELVDVSRNSRVWSDQFHRKVADILTLQEEIAWKISQGLRLRLNSEDEKRLKKRYTENVEAYLSYSLGRYYFSKNTKEGFQKSLECYEKATNMDSEYALAYAALSMTYHYIQARGFKVPKEALHKQESAAVAAVALDDSLSEAHVALAQVRYIQHDWIACDKESRRALELDPNSFEANFRYAMILAQSGRSEEAIPYAKRADELDETKSRPVLGYVYFVGRQYDKAIDSYLSLLKDAPNNAQFHFFLGEAYVTKGMFEEGIAELQKAVALDNDPERWDRYPALAYAFAVSGKRQAALNILAEQKRLAQRGYISHFNFAIIYTGLGDRDRAFEHLNKAIDDGMPLAHLPTRPLFDSLRSDPRYSFLMQRTGRAS